ncbi:hypothetical protein A2U01_0111475, partial [Trifolium medium]|nr:hypothetical protein [Trifolium medium]
QSRSKAKAQLIFLQLVNGECPDSRNMIAGGPMDL